jgi:hypothetical protein
MARRVFFSFHYDDIFAVNVVRNSDIIRAQYDQTSRGFFDKSLWEEMKKQGDRTIRSEIDRALEGSSVTCVLIGEHTWGRPWVRYELLKSFERTNGIIGIHIHDVAKRPRPSLASLLYPTMVPVGNTVLTASRPVPARGRNPLDYLGFLIEFGRPGNILAGLTAGKRAGPCQLIGQTWTRDNRIGAVPMNSTGYRLGRFTQGQKLSTLFKVYDWKAGNGYEQFKVWVENAALAPSWV